MASTTGLSRPKHVPERSCVICRTKRPKRELVRIVRTPEGPVTLDLTGRANGRGAYICRTESCWANNTMRARLKAALNAEITDELRKLLGEHISAESGITGPAPRNE